MADLLEAWARNVGPGPDLDLTKGSDLCLIRILGGSVTRTSLESPAVGGSGVPK